MWYDLKVVVDYTTKDTKGFHEVQHLDSKSEQGDRELAKFILDSSSTNLNIRDVDIIAKNIYKLATSHEYVSVYKKNVNNVIYEVFAKENDKSANDVSKGGFYGEYFFGNPIGWVQKDEEDDEDDDEDFFVADSSTNENASGVKDVWLRHASEKPFDSKPYVVFNPGSLGSYSMSKELFDSVYTKKDNFKIAWGKVVKAYFVIVVALTGAAAFVTVVDKLIERLFA